MDEEFATEKERVFTGWRAMPAGAEEFARLETSKPFNERSSFSVGYDGDRQGKIMVGLVGLDLLAGGVWRTIE